MMEKDCSDNGPKKLIEELMEMTEQRVQDYYEGQANIVDFEAQMMLVTAEELDQILREYDEEQERLQKEKEDNGR